MKIAVQFDIPEPTTLTSGDVVFPNRRYRFPEPFLQKQSVAWHALNRDESKVGTRLHEMLLWFGFSPMGGCSCNSLAGRLNANTIDWNEQHSEETVSRIVRNVKKHYQSRTIRLIFRQIFGSLMVLVCKCIPSVILPIAIRHLLRLAIRSERKRIA